MKRHLMLAALMIIPTASAQLWTVDQPKGTLSLKGCYVVKEGVRCDLTFTLTGTNSSNLGFGVHQFQAVTTAGQSVQASQASFAGQGFSQYPTNVQVFKNAPVQVSVLFDLPNNVTSLKVLAVNDEAMMNVPVARSASATTPAVSTPAPAAAVPTGFAIELRDCKTNQGIYTCTAVLTPVR